MRPQTRYRVLGFLFALSIITFLDRVCISDAGPRMQAELGLGPVAWGWVLGVFSFAYAAFEIPSGMLGDRVGPGPVLTRIVLWWSAFTALTGAVWNAPQLIVVRLLFGAGEAGAYPNSSVCVARWFGLAERARAQGVIFMASRLGGALAPLLVIPLQRAYGWRMSFYVFATIGVLWALAWRLYYQDPPVPPEPGQHRHRGSLRQVLRHRPMQRLSLMSFTYHYGAFFFLSWLPTFMVKGLGLSEQQILWSSLPFLLGAVANLGGGVLSDVLVEHHGLGPGRRFVGMCGLGAAAVFLSLALLGGPLWLVMAWLSLCYASLELTVPANWAVCLDIGGEQAGAASGCMNMAGQLGGFFSSVCFGYLVEHTGSYRMALAPAIALMLAGLWLWSGIDAEDKVA